MTFPFYGYQPEKQYEQPLNNLVSNLLGGYTSASNAKYLQPNLEEALQKSKLYNKWYEPNIKSEIGLRGAQAGHLGAMTQGLNISNPYLHQKLEDEQTKRAFETQNPLLKMTGPAGQLGALLYLQHHPELAQMQGQNKPQVSEETRNMMNQLSSSIPSILSSQHQEQQNPLSAINPQELMLKSILNTLQPQQKQFAPSNLGKLQQEYADIQAGYYPNTRRSVPFESSQIQEEVASPYREKLGGLKTGEHYVYDPETHEKVGIQRPYTPKEKETEVGRAFFNEVFPTINKGFKDFIGKGSINNFIKYANEYGKNEFATRKIDDLLLAQKLISPGVVNEAATLGAGKTNMTYRNLLNSFPNSDLPKIIEQYKKQLVLPSQAFFKAGIRFNDIVNQATSKSAASVPALKTQYYHPEKHEIAKEEKSTRTETMKHYTDSDIRATAQKYGISEEEVRKQLKKANKNG